MPFRNHTNPSVIVIQLFLYSQSLPHPKLLETMVLKEIENSEMFTKRKSRKWK